MIINVDSSCSLFFGDASTFTLPPKDENFPAACNALRQKLNLKHLVFLRQTHSTIGYAITEDTQLTKPSIIRETEGDYLITTQRSVGIGAMAADCLQIVFYDPQQQTIAVAHAGWKGSVTGISSIVINKLQELGSNAQDLRVYFGPAARACCYEVQEDFLKPELMDFIIRRNNKYFFDNTAFNKHLLLQMGIPQGNINPTNNLCTICNHQFRSYRRAEDKNNYIVQATIVWLK